MINHQTWAYSAGIPLSVGDRYYAQDLGRDFYFHQDAIGSAILAINNVAQGTPTLLKMAAVTVDGTTPNTTLDVPLGSAILPFTATIPASYASLPPTATTATVNMFINWAAFTIAVNTLGCTGVATYNLYATYTETVQATRARAKASGSYGYEVTPTLTLGATTGAIPAGSVLLCTFTYNSGSSPITSVVQPTIVNEAITRGNIQSQLITPILVTSGSAYNLVSGSTPTLLINRTTNPFPVNLPAATGSGYEVDIVNITALATGLVKIVPFSGDALGPLAANVAAYLQNVDQSGTVGPFQHLTLKDSKAGIWEIVGGQFMPEPGSIDSAGSQYFLGKLRHLPLNNVTERNLTIIAAAQGSWSATQQITGPLAGNAATGLGIPTGAKAVRLCAVLSPSVTSAGLYLCSVMFSDNTANIPSQFTPHPKVCINGYLPTIGSPSELNSVYIDVPLNSLGQLFVYSYFLDNVNSLSIQCKIVGYYMGD